MTHPWGSSSSCCQSIDSITAIMHQLMIANAGGNRCHHVLCAVIRAVMCCNTCRHSGNRRHDVHPVSRHPEDSSTSPPQLTNRIRTATSNTSPPHTQNCTQSRRQQYITSEGSPQLSKGIGTATSSTSPTHRKLHPVSSSSRIQHYITSPVVLPSAPNIDATYSYAMLWQ
jgi:hypothetical protein